MKSIIGYYRLGQSYPRTQLREDYPRKKRTFIPIVAAPAEDKITSLPLDIGDTDVRLSYSTGFARTSQEARNPGLRAGLVGHWDFSLGATGDRAYDVSGRGNNGTLVNEPLFPLPLIS